MLHYLLIVNFTETIFYLTYKLTLQLKILIVYPLYTFYLYES